MNLLKLAVLDSQEYAIIRDYLSTAEALATDKETAARVIRRALADSKRVYDHRTITDLVIVLEDIIAALGPMCDEAYWDTEAFPEGIRCNARGLAAAKDKHRDVLISLRDRVCTHDLDAIADVDDDF